MANAVYPLFKGHLLNGDVDAGIDTCIAYLVDLADYTYNTAHDVLADLAVASRVANVTLSGVTASTTGVFDSTDPTFASVTGDQAEALVITINGYLAAYYDTGVTGLPVTPNGGDIDVTVNGSGWFSV